MARCTCISISLLRLLAFLTTSPLASCSERKIPQGNAIFISQVKSLDFKGFRGASNDLGRYIRDRTSYVRHTQTSADDVTWRLVRRVSDDHAHRPGS